MGRAGWSRVVVALAVIAAAAIAAPAFGGPSLKKLVKQEVAKQLAGKTGPQGPQGEQGPPGPATGPAGGDLTGNYPAPQIAGDAVGAPELQNFQRNIVIPASEIGAGALAPEGAAGDPDFGFVQNTPALLFDQTTPEAIDLLLRVPDDRVEGTQISVGLYTSAPATGIVRWRVEARAMGSFDAVNVAPALGQERQIIMTTQNVLVVSFFDANVDLAANGDMLLLRIRRVADNDSLAADARLHMVEVSYAADR